MGTFTGARRYVLHTFATTQSAMMKKRVSQYMLSTACPTCHGKRLRQESLAVTFAGLDIADMSRLPLKQLIGLLIKHGAASDDRAESIAAKRIIEDMSARLNVLLDMGLGYLTLERSTPTLSPGELQRLRLATQVYSNLFGVVYVLDEPSAGLHPSDTEALLRALDKLKAAGNSLFVVEHELDIVRHADWIVDVGPNAGEHGGQILYSGPLDGLREVKHSQTAEYLFGGFGLDKTAFRSPRGWLEIANLTINNLDRLRVSFPLGVLTSVTGVSGSGKSSLVSQALVSLVADALGQSMVEEQSNTAEIALQEEAPPTTEGTIVSGIEAVKRLVVVDQKPIGRTPRSNLATYTGIFDGVRKLFAATEMAKSRRYDAGRFSFNVGKGRCNNCQGEGFVMVELLFLPSVYAPCPVCNGTRFNAQTLEVMYHGKNIADVLGMNVHTAALFFGDEIVISRGLETLIEVGLGYLRLGQPATELSGGEAQRIKLATELQRPSRGQTLYILDEPTTGLHPSDVKRLLVQLDRLVDAGNTVILVEHDMEVIGRSDWVIDMGPGAGDEGGKIVARGSPKQISSVQGSKTGRYLKRVLHR
jgi:excinuclease ABC subunit A